MSWTPEAVVLCGYRVSRDIWQKGFEYCEDNCESNPAIPEDWEDYFIDMDNPGGNESETFFGSIIYTVPEDGYTVEFDSIFTHYETIIKVQSAFKAIFSRFYKDAPLPSYRKYLGCRWV